MGRLEQLAEKFSQHLALPWQRTVSGAQRVIIIVYDPQSERNLKARMDVFEQAARAETLTWHEIDISSAFSEWMAQDVYRDAYFETPEDLSMKIEMEFPSFVAEYVRQKMEALAVSDDSVVAVHGVGSLFGFTHVSRLLHDLEPNIRGRLVVFFPGQKDGNNYRLLDARDGWNYLAVPITLG